MNIEASKLIVVCLIGGDVGQTNHWLEYKGGNCHHSSLSVLLVDKLLVRTSSSQGSCLLDVGLDDLQLGFGHSGLSVDFAKTAQGLFVVVL